MIRLNDLRLGLEEPTEALRDRAAKKLRLKPERIEELKLLRRSLDARDKSDLHYVCSAAVTVRGSEELLVRRLRDRSRKLLEVAEVLGIEEGQIRLSTLYRFKETGEQNGKIIGVWEKEEEILHRFKFNMAGIDL